MLMLLVLALPLIITNLFLNMISIGLAPVFPATASVAAATASSCTKEATTTESQGSHDTSTKKSPTKV